MQIVIDIPEDVYEKSRKDKYVIYNSMYNAIREGTPLPEGHGRLIDANEILVAMDSWDKFGYTETGCFIREPKNDYVPYVHYEDMVNSVNNAPTIIEADGEDNNADCD